MCAWNLNNTHKISKVEMIVISINLDLAFEHWVQTKDHSWLVKATVLNFGSAQQYKAESGNSKISFYLWRERIMQGWIWSNKQILHYIMKMNWNGTSIYVQAKINRYHNSVYFLHNVFLKWRCTQILIF